MQFQTLLQRPDGTPLKLASVAVLWLDLSLWGILIWNFFNLESRFKAELINCETLFYKEMRNMQDPKQFSSHESVEVTPAFSPYCIIYRVPLPNPSPSHKRKKDEKSCEEPDFFIYLFIFISCPSSKLKANHGEADFHLHTLQPSNCVTRPFSNTTLAAVQSQRRSKEI